MWLRSETGRNQRQGIERKRVRETEKERVGEIKSEAKERNRKNRVHATQIFSLVHSSTTLFHYLQINEAIEKQSR